MQPRELLYEGKAKRLFTTDDPNLLLAEFKDDLTAFNGEKHDTEAGKGALNNKISTELFKLLADNGIPTHYVDTPDDNHMLVKKVDIILIEVGAQYRHRKPLQTAGDSRRHRAALYTCGVLL